MSPNEQFLVECAKEIELQGANQELRDATTHWMNIANKGKYSYHFQWLGRPIIQYPQDVMALQEIIFAVRPTVIVEAGIAHGGSLILSASLLRLLDLYEAAEKGEETISVASKRKVIGIDIDIRAHNRAAIEAHPLSGNITLIEGSSIAPDTVERVKQQVPGDARVLVILDSNHTHEHVLRELEAYAPLVSPGSYCIVFDTVIEDMSDDMFPDRPWGKGDNPKTAVWEYLKHNPEFTIDRSVENKLMITVAPDGFLKRAG
ncbi:cephalosporin hydroxylase [Sphingomonas changnyeongensis]|uniref:Cephalosporin hydroxylase n=1 Tax=Sphingomonas changnyeongensis TaxID=2698679 RepID=A0A7Z2NUW4_9SPHN|nr:cephalosporin hydroxylase family protein [Sphingomonas changnyeongensis]QHL90230.1 cephalosporin hydroxylase [Sphingomonas changnyeongensis]